MTCGSVICYIGDRIGCWTRKDPDPVQGEGLEDAFEKIGSLRPWMWMVFFLCTLPGILNIWALLSNTFQAAEIPYWCYIPELQNTNWTQEQIRIITTGRKKSSCKYKKHDYEKLSTMSFEEAEQTTKESEVDSTTCKKFSYENPETSIVAEWDMVCSGTVYKSTLLTVVSIGKFSGAFVFGPIADRYGRKRSIFISCMFYMFVGPAGIIGNYYVFLVMRFSVGVAGSGLFNCCFTLLMETCQKKHRTLLGILYNQSYAIGLLLLPAMSLAFPKWRHLQLALFSLPPMTLLLTCCYIYIVICGVLETISYLIPIPILRFVGRRTTSAMCFFIGALGLFVVIFIPKDISAAIMSCALLARLAIGSVYSVVILYTAEMFPTINRNTAIGTTSTMSHVGGFSAPYIVDLLGQIEWFIPSTICAALSLVAFFMVKLLPETRGTELSNTIEEVNEAEKKVSFKNCLCCGK